LERACWNRHLEPDFIARSWCKADFLAHVEPEIEVIQWAMPAALAYDNFDPTKVTPTIDAADQLARRLPSAIAAFRQAIDLPA